METATEARIELHTRSVRRQCEQQMSRRQRAAQESNIGDGDESVGTDTEDAEESDGQSAIGAVVAAVTAASTPVTSRVLPPLSTADIEATPVAASTAQQVVLTALELMRTENYRRILFRSVVKMRRRSTKNSLRIW
jgi:hypothetical protein